MKRLALISSAVVALLGCTSSSSTPPPASDAGVSDTGADAALPSFDFTQLHAVLYGGAWKTEGVVVQYKGQVVYEEYAPGWTASMRHITYSASKSIGSAIVGIAIQDGLMGLHDSVCKFITQPTGADPKLCDTTIENVLQMTSGLTWAEDYGTDPTTSDVLQMLYGNQADMGAYVAAHARAAAAGTKWQYSSGDSDLLANALRGALKGQDVRAYIKQKLFDPAGLSSAIFEVDRAGTPVFSSSCFMTPRDMAKFGQLYLDDGMSGTTRVLPVGWVAYTLTRVGIPTQPSPRVADAGPGNTGGGYGASFWFNAPTPTATPDTWMYPEAPVDAFSAEGHYGQKIFMVPSRSLVVARVGNDRDPTFDPGPMVAAAVAAIDKGGK